MAIQINPLLHRWQHHGSYKEVKYALDTKTVTRFDGSNYEAWRVGILADAEVIGGIDILLKNQRESPATRPIVDKWKIRSKALYRRMLSSLIGNVRTTIGALEADNAAALWDKINIEYAISLAEERVNVFRELTRLQVRDNDYLHSKDVSATSSHAIRSSVEAQKTYTMTFSSTAYANSRRRSSNQSGKISTAPSKIEVGKEKMTTPNTASSGQPTPDSGLPYERLVIPMPIPGAPGASFFDGRDVTAFVDRYEAMCTLHFVAGSEALA
ncbi:hypothetical protein ACJ73_09381, partial [Blastomyces percursus]